MKEMIEEGLVWTSYILSKQHVANVLTKGLNNHNSNDIIAKLGMENIYSSAWEGCQIVLLSYVFIVIIAITINLKS